MSLKVRTDIPYGNACAVEVASGGDMPEVRFAASPRGGPESLWFCFRVVESNPAASQEQGKVRVTLRFFDNVLGAGAGADLAPVFRPSGQGWHRMSGGVTSLSETGHCAVSWTIPHPAPETDVALCFPYGEEDAAALVAKSKGSWKTEEIGVSTGGRPIVRLFTDSGEPNGTRQGIYLVARQHAGETPGSWVLDGLMQQLSKSRRSPFVVWAVPLLDADGVAAGEYGKDNFPCDFNRAWGLPPMRHEVLAVQRDIALWQTRCKPVLALDFHAPGACETDGVYALLPNEEKLPDAFRAAEKWANVIQQDLGEFAAGNFKRQAACPSRWDGATFTTYMASILSIPALALEIPYSRAGTTVLAQRQYRDIGARLATALMHKVQ
ncbi:MAG: hypothetical protein FJ224_01390 [Lentisphaerae bacterium]|nr:hypothetical protein [Lentisphaerota bacterium]